LCSSIIKSILVQTDEERKGKMKKYQLSEKGKAKRKEYIQSGKAKAVSRKYALSEKGYQGLRVKVLQYYSKVLSNSDVPCCNCCGKNNFIGFLALDHILGRKQMDSEPELIKLGYTSKLNNQTLMKWIIKNNFPEGFQILCHNCNMAKGFYGTCPHERK
jgi:hypothetical protein